MFTTSITFAQNSSRLLVEGFPDTSLGQSEGTIGIISIWRLELIGKADLEGKREHLESLMKTVLPYARYLLSGVCKYFGNSDSPVSISFDGSFHNLSLKSSQPDIEPLTVLLDDAELADLVRCLDQLKYDSRINLNWSLPSDNPLPHKDLVVRVPMLQRISAPLFGGLTFFATAFLLILLSVQISEQHKELDSPRDLTSRNSK